MNTPKSSDVKNKKILIRVDFNISNFKKDHYRLSCIEETIDFLLKSKVKQIILISHLGRPKGRELEYSLKKLVPLLEKIYHQKIKFYDKLTDLPEDKIILLENIRFWKEEDINDLSFAKKLASLGDVFINEAFSVSHRSSTSLCAITKFLPTFYGFNFVKEIEGIDNIYKNIKQPFVAILGGNKVLDKWPLALALRKKAKYIFLGGVMANTYLAGLDGKGIETGKSLVDREALKQFKFPLSFADDFTIPVDFVVITKDKKIDFVMSMEVGEEDVIVDTGFFSFQNIQTILKDAKTIFWNGPLGYAEEKPFDKSTKELVKILTKSKAKIIIGGGETLEFVKPLMNKKNVFVSSGGGAMLYHLINGTFPCLKK